MLLACANCSSPPILIVGPCWIAAQLTSAKEKSPHFSFVGMCRHADPFGRAGVVAGFERPLIEARWNEEANKLLAERTARWTVEERARFRRLLGYDPQIDAGQAELPVGEPVTPPDPTPGLP